MSHMRAVERFASQLCRDQQNAHDLVQETMLKAYTNFASYRQGTNCQSWLFRICRNSYVNEFRRRKRCPLLLDFQDGSSETGTGDTINEHPLAASVLRDDSDIAVHRNCFSDEVFEALQVLPAEYQTAIILCDIEGSRYDEIAEFMGTPVGTVRSRIHRGRMILASLLAKQRTGNKEWKSSRTNTSRRME
jgi:RNA polymerase sigma-70 factor (ECF subfamily)